MSFLYPAPYMSRASTVVVMCEFQLSLQSSLYPYAVAHALPCISKILGRADVIVRTAPSPKGVARICR